MPQIYLCFLWHMHQPFYKDLISGEYKLPWTRLHALKDYYGMVRILEEFPRLRQTFNLVPSLLVQVKDYAAGGAFDPYWQAALKPAENLNEAEQDFLLQHSFYSHPPRMIYRYLRYGELYDARRAQSTVERVRRLFGVQEFRDLQVLSQLAWFDEEFLRKDPEVVDLVTRGRNFTLSDQQLMEKKQREILNVVLPCYAKMAASGQIEISTTPYYHPILPLLCDSDIAAVSHPGVPLPPRFRYPRDAREQLVMAREFVAAEFGSAPAGLWPSEGSVSDEVFSLAAETGFRWAATDSGVLARTLGRAVGVDAIYRPYRWKQRGRELNVIFRDHFLSDLIGFVYSHMGAREAAEDFLHRIRENCRPILATGRDALVPIILDGENAWEYYELNGRPFLRELYGLISKDDGMTATTVADALRRMEVQTLDLDLIFPGSWINANFDVWIGAEEDNQAWAHLLQARQSYEASRNVAPEQKRLAYEELLIAEGSDWCWWYGPEHSSPNRVEFDQLFRSHLANVYRFLGLAPPDELSRPILKDTVREFHLAPSGPIQPVIDGEITSYFEWIGAGNYRVDQRTGSMHGKKFPVRELYYGADGSNLYLRLDFQPAPDGNPPAMEARLSLETAAGPSSVVIGLDRGTAGVTETKLAADSGERSVECAFKKLLEIRVSQASLGATAKKPVRFQFSFWQDGLPIGAIPQQGWLELPTADPSEWLA